MTPALVASLADYVRNFKMDVTLSAEGHSLHIPGFHPFEWRVPVRRRLFRRSRNRHRFEEATTAAFCFFLEHRNIRTFMDVGAHYGYFSLLALSYKARPIDVHAFEFQPAIHAALAASLKDLPGGGGAEALLAGMSDRHLGRQPVWQSKTKMFESEPHPSHYSDSQWVKLKFALRGERNRDAPQKSETTITSIDHYCAENNVVPDVVKIDVDGYEAKVVPGGMATFQKHRPVVFLELHRARYISRFGLSRTEILRPLFEAGYSALLLEDHFDLDTAITPVEADSSVIERDATDMYLFC